MSRQGYWADQSAPDLRDLPKDLVVILPTGAIEQHGPHLPLSVDRDLVDAVIARALGRLHTAQNVLVLPTLSVTKSDEHNSFAGTLSLSASTLLAVLRDIAASLVRAGVTRLVILNGHGGNTPTLDIAARDMRETHAMIVATASWFGFAEYGPMFDQERLVHDIHAGDLETSAMLATRPDLVDMNKAQNFSPAQAQWQSHWIGLSGHAARPAWIAQDLHPDGACGDASAATAEKGAALLDSAARNFATFLEEFATFDHRSDT